MDNMITSFRNPLRGHGAGQEVRHEGEGVRIPHPDGKSRLTSLGTEGQDRTLRLLLLRDGDGRPCPSGVGPEKNLQRQAVKANTSPKVHHTACGAGSSRLIACL